MFAVGMAYNDEESCKLEAASFLAIGGGLVSAIALLGPALLGLLAICTPSETHEKIMKLLTPISSLAHFGLMIWGSVVVFGPYSTWTSEDKNSDGYCAQTPFMFAFVILILNWIIFPILVCICWAERFLQDK